MDNTFEQQPLYAILDLPTNQFVELDIGKFIQYTSLPSKNAVAKTVAGAYILKEFFLEQFDVSIRKTEHEIREVLENASEVSRWATDPSTVQSMAEEQVLRLTLRLKRITEQKQKANFVVVELTYRIVYDAPGHTVSWSSDVLCPFSPDGFSTKMCTAPESMREECKKQ